ncbi:LysR family transcriptional regulator [Nocardioides marinquilinus]|uniref:LysR family transcriptional regulator n=1 Tax=Nocardioides marinquilinus TaxID=1210400 RepID=A0ABP9P6Z9_9ACTN
MPDLTLAGLHVVLEVARSGSFTAAADELGYTQSAVSRQVGAVEAAVGSPVFERRPRGVALTEAGQVLARHARRVLDQLAAAELEIAGLRDRLAGRLVVGAFPVAAATWVPRTIARLREAHPGLAVELREAGSPAQLRQLQRGRIEVAVVARGAGLPAHDLAPLRAETLSRGRFGVAVADAHPLARRSEVEADDLADEPWVAGAGEGPQFGAWPTLAEPRIAFRVPSWTTRLGLVAAGLGVTLVPAASAAIVPRGVTWVPIRDPQLEVDRETVVVTAPERSPGAEAFVRALHEVAAEGTLEPG